MANRTVGVNIAFNADTSKAKAQIQELQTLLNKITYSGATGAGQNKISDDLKNASAAAKELQYHLNNAYNANTGKLDLSLLDKSLKTTGSNITDLSTNLLSAGATGQQAFVKMAQSISQAEQPMLKINSKVKDFANTLKNAAKYQIGNVVVQGFMSSITSAIGYAKDLNSSLNEIRIVSGKSADEMARFAEEANKAAKRLSTTTTDYTNASLIYYQQGLSEADVAARTETTIKMANVAGTSAQTVSDQMTAVWNNFYDGSKSLEYYSDVMVKLGAATASSTDEISQGVNKFAATAKTVGLSYEYATAALATVTATTRESADTVGNAFKTLFSRIQGLNLGETLDDGTTLNKYSKALQSVGISIKDQGGQLKEMDQILDEMGDKWGTLGEAEKMALAQTVGGARQYTQLMALMENWDYFKENLDVAYNSEGALEEQAKVYEESWAAASKRVEASLQGVYQSLLDDKFFISINNGFANALGGLEAFIEGAGGAKTIITGLASVMIGAFANKIPDALQTAKYNIDLLTKGSDVAYQRIQTQMQEAQGKAFTEHGIKEDSSMGMQIKYANDLLEARNRLAQVSDNLTSAERVQYETELALVEIYQKEAVALQEKNEALSKSITTTMNNSLGNNIDDSANADKRIEAYKSQDWDQQDSFKKIRDSYGELLRLESSIDTSIYNSITQSLKDAQVATKGLTEDTELYFSVMDGSGGKFETQFNDITEELVNMGDKTGEEFNLIQNHLIDFTNLLPNSVKQVGRVRTALASLKDADSSPALRKAWQQLGQVLGKDKITLKEFYALMSENTDPATLRKFIKDAQELGVVVQDSKEKVEQLKQVYNNFNPQSGVHFSTTMVNLASAATSAFSAINSVVSAAKALGNDDLGGWEKFSTVMLSLPAIMTTGSNAISKGKQIIDDWQSATQKAAGAAVQLIDSNKMNTIATESLKTVLGGVTSLQKGAIKGFEEERQVLIKNIAAKYLAGEVTEEVAKKDIAAALAEVDLAGASAKDMAAQLLTTVAKEGHGKVTWKLVAAQLGLNAAMLPYIAIIGAVVGLVYAAVKAYNADADAAKKAAEAAKEAAEEYNAIKDAYQDLKDTISSIDEGQEALKNMTKGTDEWRESVIELNNEVTELVGMYQGLSGAVISVNGVLTIDKESDDYKAFMEQQQEQLNFAARSSYGAQVYANDAETKSQNTNVRRNVGYKVGYGEDAYWQSISQSDLDKVVNAYNGGNGKAVFDADYLKNLGIADDQMISSIINASDEISALAVAVQQNTQANELFNEQVVSGYLSGDEKYQSSEYQDEINDAVANKLAEADTTSWGGKYKDEKGNTWNDEQVQREYAKLMGYEWVSNGWGKGTYLKADGTNVTVNDETARYALNQEKWLKENATDSMDAVSNFFDTYKEEEGKISKEMIKAAVSGDKSALTEKDLNVEGTVEKLLDDNEIAQLKELFGDNIIAALQNIVNQEYTPEEETNQFDLSSWKSQYNTTKDIVKDLEIGDTIGAADYEQLSAAAQQFFVETEDGIFTLTQDAEQLKDVVNDIAGQELKDQITKFQEGFGGISQEQASKWAEEIAKGHYNDKGVSTSDSGQAYINGINEEYGTSFTSFGEAFAYANEKLLELQSGLASTADELGELDDLMSNGQIGSQAYIDQLQAIAAGYENCSEELLAYQKALSEADEEAATLADEALRGAIRAGELAKKYDLSAEAIERYAEEIGDSGKYEKANSQALAEMAKDQLRYDRAVKKCKDNITDWRKELAYANKTGHLASDVAEELADTYGDFLDIDGDLLPSSFLKDVDNLNLMQQAIQGNDEAYDMLLEKSREAIAIKLNIDDQQFQQDFNNLLNTYYQAQSLNDIEVGASLNDEGFLNELSNLVNATCATADEATNYLASMGVDATVIEDPVETQDTQTYVSATPTISWHRGIGTNPVTGGLALYNFPDVRYNTTTETIPTSKTTTGVALKVTAANKSSGGAVKRGGSNAVSKPASGGGGGGSKPKHAEKKNDSDKERYHTLTNQLEDIKAEYDDISEASDRAFGKDKLKNLDAQIEKTDELIDKQEEYLDAIEANLPVDKAVMDAYYQDTIGGPVIEYDERGNIANYDAIQDAMFAKYNSMADAYDEDSTEWQVFEKKYEQLEKYIEQYEETYDLLRDQEQEYQDLLNQRIDLQLEKVQYTVELKLNVSEDQVKLIEYQLGKVEDDGFKSLEAIGLLTNKAGELNKQIEANKQGLNDALKLSLSAAEIAQVMAGNMDVLNGKNFTDDQISAIKDYRDSLLDLNEELDEIRETVEEKLMEAFDAWQEKLEKGIDTIDHYGSVLESYKNIIDIVGTDTLGLSDEFMNNLSQGSVDNAINKLEAVKAEYHTVESARAEAEEKLADARASGDTKSAEMWEKTLEDLTEKSQEAEENMLSAWEDALSKVAEQFEQSVERIVNNFNKSVYKMGGLEGLSNDFAKQQEEADMMLDDYQKIYELSKLSRDINKSIDDTDLIGGKQKLKKLLGEVNALQEDGVEMSQYDLEYLQKTYDLRLAELELEEAQRAKNTVRLSKDNEGNWSYVYTQNTDAVDAAQQKYEDALYAMQDLSSNYIDEMSEKLIETSQEMAEALAELRVQDFASIDDYYAEVDRVEKYYQDQLKFQEGELNKAITNNKELYENDWTAYHTATGYKISDTEDFVTAFKDSMLGNLMNSESATANFTDLIAGSVNTMTEQLLAAAKTYYDNVNTAMNAADTSVEDFGDDAAAAIDKVVTKSDEGAKAVENMADRMNTAVSGVMSNIQTWQETYGKMMEQIVQDNLDVIDSINDLVGALSLEDFDASVAWSFTPKDKDTEEVDTGYDTGGYTGSWGKDGKLAILHEKELVLNAEDTANMLSMLQLTHDLLDMLDLQTQTAKLGFGDLVASTIKDSQKEVLEQKVEITAEFPNVSDHNEIEEALMNLTNTASQYANRK